MPTSFQPIVGYNGLLRVGSGLTMNELVWAGEWEVEAAFDVAVFGPFIGDKGKKYPVTTGLLMKISIKGTVPKASSPALNAIKYGALVQGVVPQIELGAQDADWYQFPTPAIESFKTSAKGDGSVEFEIKAQASLGNFGQLAS